MGYEDSQGRSREERQAERGQYKDDDADVDRAQGKTTFNKGILRNE